MDKKNTLLLTVIAIATLLVAVVGATFAYFTAQNGTGATAQATVTTSSVDTATLEGFKTLTLKATQQNFGEDMGSLYAESEGTVQFKANADQASDYCYKVELNIEAEGNNFEYALDSSKPELIFTISKGSASGSEIEYTATSIGKTNTLTYHSAVLGETTKLCKYNGEPSTQSTDCDDSKALNGYDITDQKNITVEIPNNQTGGTKDESFTGDAELGKYIHKISATAGNTVTDYWKARITFVNYNEDQQKNAQLNNDITKGKTLNAVVNFIPVSCDKGEKITKS